MVRDLRAYKACRDADSGSQGALRADFRRQGCTGWGSYSGTDAAVKGQRSSREGVLQAWVQMQSAQGGFLQARVEILRGEVASVEFSGVICRRASGVIREHPGGSWEPPGDILGGHGSGSQKGEG